MCVLQALSVYCVNVFGVRVLSFKVCCFNTTFIYYLTTIFTYTYLLNGSFEYIVTALDIFCVCEPNYLKMAAKWGRNM
jgi:hypothetical protein